MKANEQTAKKDEEEKTEKKNKLKDISKERVEKEENKPRNTMYDVEENAVAKIEVREEREMENEWKEKEKEGYSCHICAWLVHRN